jgi:hypothetical protein
MDAGTFKDLYTWYEMGRNPGALATGLPHPGVVHGETNPNDTFLFMPYTGNNAVLLDGMHRTSTITFASPTPAVGLHSRPVPGTLASKYRTLRRSRLSFTFPTPLQTRRLPSAHRTGSPSRTRAW